MATSELKPQKTYGLPNELKMGNKMAALVSSYSLEFYGYIALDLEIFSVLWFGSYSHSGIPGFLFWLFSGYSYSGIFLTNAPLA